MSTPCRAAISDTDYLPSEGKRVRHNVIVSFAD